MASGISDDDVAMQLRNVVAKGIHQAFLDALKRE